MDETSRHTAPPFPIEIGRLREILEGIMNRVCPAWLSAQREDLVQNACLRMVRIWQSGEEPRRFGASYLWRVAHTTVMDEIRQRRRQREVGWEGRNAEEPMSESSSPDRSLSTAELRGAILEGVRRLEESRRWAVLLYLYGFSLEESARMLGWNTKRVDNRRYQGLAELRAYLKGRGFAP